MSRNTSISFSPLAITWLCSEDASQDEEGIAGLQQQDRP
jgi:hypothetical protein